MEGSRACEVLDNVCGYEKLRPKGVIWVSPEPRGEPHIRCYTPRRPKGGERSVA